MIFCFIIGIVIFAWAAFGAAAGGLTLAAFAAFVIWAQATPVHGRRRRRRR